MDIAKHKETIRHLKGIIREMNEIGWANINIIETNILINEMTRQFSIRGDRRRLMKREIFKLLIIMNAKSWHSVNGGKYHKYINCSDGNNIESENIDIGKGEEELCGSCQDIQDELRRRRK